jgi:hypothetical protein
MFIAPLQAWLNPYNGTSTLINLPGVWYEVRRAAECKFQLKSTTRKVTLKFTFKFVLLGCCCGLRVRVGWVACQLGPAHCT